VTNIDWCQEKFDVLESEKYKEKEGILNAYEIVSNMQNWPQNSPKSGKYQII
jgi:hypothetical protein